jgi:hypothetical protein
MSHGVDVFKLYKYDTNAYPPLDPLCIHLKAVQAHLKPEVDA